MVWDRTKKKAVIPVRQKYHDIWMLKFWNSAILCHIEEGESVCLGGWCKTLQSVFQRAHWFPMLSHSQGWFTGMCRGNVVKEQKATIYFLSDISPHSHRWNAFLTEVNNKISIKDACVFVSAWLQLHLYV